jgi:hypothetical protein
MANAAALPGTRLENMVASRTRKTRDCNRSITSNLCAFVGGYLVHIAEKYEIHKAATTICY